MKIIDIRDTKPDFRPRCPFCREQLEEIYRVTDDKGFFHDKLGYCYVCPHCESQLDFADQSH